MITNSDDIIYKKKYIQYKKKYLDLKNKKQKYTQSGGNVDIANLTKSELDYIQNKISNLSDFDNLGQRNCGVIFIRNYVIKCLGLVQNINKNYEADESYLNLIEEINSIDTIVKHYKWDLTHAIKYFLVRRANNNNKMYFARCTIMEKLDGDLGMYLLKKAYENTFKNTDNFDWFYQMLPKTNERRLESTDEDKIKFNRIKEGMRYSILNIYNNLSKDVFMLYYNLIKNGWYYEDSKFDNIGYKIENGLLKLYFIDIASGLTKIRGKFKQFSNRQGSDKLHWKNTENELYFSSIKRFGLLSHYSILGQFNILSIFNIDLKNFDLKFDFDTNQSDLNSLIDIIERNQIFGKLYYDNNLMIVDSDTNENFKGSIAIQFINGFYRLVTFDDNLNHMSDADYNPNYPKIDMLCLSLAELLYNINKIYPISLDTLGDFKHNYKTYYNI